MAELEQAEGPAPSMIGPYRLARRLGRGGMGEVFLAWDERLGRRVAVKRILRDTPRAQDRERFCREARAAARLSHPSVVQVYDFVEDPAGDATVLEYVEGRTLRAVLAEGVPPVAFALGLAREIAEGSRRLTPPASTPSGGSTTRRKDTRNGNFRCGRG